MDSYQINKGVGKEVEFKGLKAQYIFILAGGLLGVFFLYVVMYLCGLNQWACIVFNVSLGLLHTYNVFRLNGKYGSHGLMKKAASKRVPERIIHRKAIVRLLK